MEAATATKPLYVYGVVGQAPAPAAEGIAGAQVTTIATDDGLTALVSELPQVEKVALGRDELNAHAAVLSDALKSGPVLPMRFGVVLDGEDTVRTQLLQAHADELHRQLEEMKGKVELRLRATYEEQTLMREVVQEHAEIVRLREQIKGLPDAATYYERIRLGELVAQAVERKRQQDTEGLLNALLGLSQDHQVGEPNHERVALNASFLVEEPQIPKFDQAVDELGRAHQGRMRMKYTGPLPPYSFVELGGG